MRTCCAQAEHRIYRQGCGYQRADDANQHHGSPVCPENIPLLGELQIECNDQQQSRIESAGPFAVFIIGRLRTMLFLKVVST